MINTQEELAAMDRQVAGASSERVKMSDGSDSGYTRQELWDILKPAFEDEIAGRVYAAEDVFAQMRERINGDKRKLQS